MNASESIITLSTSSFSPSSLSLELSTDQKPQKTLHVLYGIHFGEKRNDTMIAEWEVSLKSILSNAPTDNDVNIHILANNNATETITKRIDEIGLVNSRWGKNITLSLYNIETKLEEWTTFLEEKVRGLPLDKRVSIGGYFRLLAYQILSKRDIDEVLYLDTDVVILANLNDLMRYMNTTHEENKDMIWQYDAAWPNSGFMVINMKKFHRFWELITQLPTIRHAGDQTLLSMIVEQWPNATYRGVIPTNWNNHIGHGYRRAPHTLLHKIEEGQNVGMLHFTGGPGATFFDGPGLDKYCGERQQGPACKGHLEEYHSSWGLAEYYVRLPWKLVMYFGSSKIQTGKLGYPLKFETIVC